MKKIGLIFDTETGNTNKAGIQIAKCFDETRVEIFSAAQIDKTLIQRYNGWIFGTPSFLQKKLSDNWQFFIESDGLDLTGKTIALYSLGDQVNYPENYVDGMGLLYKKLTTLGATIVGSWPTEGYQFQHSDAIVDDKFVGLALDEDHQAKLSKDRIEQWVAQIKQPLMDA